MVIVVAALGNYCSAIVLTTSPEGQGLSFLVFNSGKRTYCYFDFVFELPPGNNQNSILLLGLGSSSEIICIFFPLPGAWPFLCLSECVFSTILIYVFALTSQLLFSILSSTIFWPLLKSSNFQCSFW